MDSKRAREDRTRRVDPEAVHRLEVIGQRLRSGELAERDALLAGRLGHPECYRLFGVNCLIRTLGDGDELYRHSPRAMWRLCWHAARAWLPQCPVHVGPLMHRAVDLMGQHGYPDCLAGMWGKQSRGRFNRGLPIPRQHALPCLCGKGCNPAWGIGERLAGYYGGMVRRLTKLRGPFANPDTEVATTERVVDQELRLALAEELVGNLK